MKQVLFIIGLFTITMGANAQKATWKEMNDFHGVMSDAFHSSEEDNLQPLKQRAGELVSKAKVWQASAVPQGYNAELAKPILKKLVKQCEAIKKSVKKKKSDAELKTLIAEAHDTFHEIMEKCRM